MKYENIVKAEFISRPNRFIASIKVEGREEIAHVKNTGRCKELFLPGAVIYVQVCDNPNRKTKYDVIAVEKDGRIINIDSQIPNKVFGEFLSSGRFDEGVTFIKPETTYKNSRFDFYMEVGDRKIFAEVKGVTLDEGGVARFPDAPTERGVKHLNELVSAVENGYEAYAVFIIQMKGIHLFEPNCKMHKEFADALAKAQEAGVKVIAYDCVVSEDSIMIDLPVMVNIN